jgi:hypothetical protein
MALDKIFGRRTHASVFVDVDAAKSVSWGRSWASGFWLQCMYNISSVKLSYGCIEEHSKNMYFYNLHVNIFGIVVES